MATPHNLFDLFCTAETLATETGRADRRHTHPGTCGHAVVCYLEGEHEPHHTVCWICAHYTEA